MNWDELYEQALDIINDVVRKPPHPPVLFHYTGPEAAHLLIERGVIRASNVKYMNDLSELRHAHEVIANVLRAEAAALPAPAEAVIEAYVSTLEKYIGEKDFYVASFSANPDLLGQWRAYCNLGHGFAVGFTGSALSRITNGVHLFRVEYDRSEQERAVRAIFKLYREPLEVASRSGDRAQLVTAATKLGVPLTLILLAFKHEAFADEREYRLFQSSDASIDPNKICFRTSGRMIIPFVEFDLAAYPGNTTGKSPLAEVVIGPCLNGVLASKSVAMLCEKIGQTPRIWQSTLPLAS